MHHYIFNGDAAELFYEKLDELHDKYVYHLLLSGLASEGEDLESIKMTKNLGASRKYCERVVGGLVNIRPQVVARLMDDGFIRLECIFTRLEDGAVGNYLYMIQRVMDWPKIGKYSCQIWYLGDTGVNQINEHWE